MVTESTKQAVWVKRITPRAWNMFRISSVAQVSVTHRAEDNGLLTKGANADNTSRTLCPDGFVLIDDLLQPRSRNSHVLEYIRH